MSALLLGMGALCAAGAGFTALSLAMERHWAQLHGRGAQPPAGLRRGLRGLGSVLLAIALLACLAGWGPVRGWVAWAGLLTGAACATSLLLAYAAGSAARALCGAALLAGVLLGAGALG